MLSVKFKEPMIVLLLASGLVSVSMGQYDDAVSITVVSIDYCIAVWSCMGSSQSVVSVQAVKKRKYLAAINFLPTV